MAKKTSERFGSVPNKNNQSSEGFGTVPNLSEKTPDHTLTIREVAKMFENAGVPRTERAILSWCYPNRQGMVKLNGFFDEAERKWYVTPSSVDAAIKEEQSRLKNKRESGPTEGFGRPSEQPSPASEGFRTPNESFRSVPNSSEADQGGNPQEQIRVLEAEIQTLKFDNEVRKRQIMMYEQDRRSFFDIIAEWARKTGELEAKVKQLEAPKQQTDQQRVIIEDKNEDTGDETANQAVPDNSTVKSVPPESDSEVTKEVEPEQSEFTSEDSPY